MERRQKWMLLSSFARTFKKGIEIKKERKRKKMKKKGKKKDQLFDRSLKLEYHFVM